MNLGLIPSLSIFVFIVSYVFITFEHKFKASKSAIALMCAGLLWLLASTTVSEDVLEHALTTAGNDIFGLVVFLLCAMTLVEVMTHLNFFDFIQTKLNNLGFGYLKLFWSISILTFFLSAVFDNLTVTIIMLQIARNFYKKESMFAMAANIVIAANAGGAWSPIGDVTTIMLWLAEKFSAVEIIMNAFIPSFVLNFVSTYLLSRHIREEDYVQTENDGSNIQLPTNMKIIIGVAMISFLFPVFMNLIGLPPYIGLALGLGVVWTLYELLPFNDPHTDTEVKMDHLLKKADLSSLKFFIGILLSVAALESMGVLEILSHFVFGDEPSYMQLVVGNVAMGLFSAIVDNVPLTALSINMLDIVDPKIWSLTALAVGTGGSCLVIGSASGIIAQGMVEGLTFGKYLKIATIPAFVGYVSAIFVWILQNNLV